MFDNIIGTRIDLQEIISTQFRKILIIESIKLKMHLTHIILIYTFNMINGHVLLTCTIENVC